MDEDIGREGAGRERLAGHDAIGERECLVGRIVDQLRTRGYYLAHIDAHAGQLLIDLRWAGQAAGRELGRRTRTYASVVGRLLPGMVTVVVAPCEASASDDPHQRSDARAVIEELLAVHMTVNAGSLPA